MCYVQAQKHLVMVRKRLYFGLKRPVLGHNQCRKSSDVLVKNSRCSCYYSDKKNSNVSEKNIHFLPLEKQEVFTAKQRRLVHKKLLQTQQWVAKSQPILLFVSGHPLHLPMTKSAHIVRHLRNVDMISMKQMQSIHGLQDMKYQHFLLVTELDMHLSPAWV